MTEAMRRYLEATQAQMDAARQLIMARCWPGFCAHEAAIARAMRADAALSLWDAYQQVVLEGHVTEDGWALTPEGFRRL
jgi:hypothetical protein